MKKNTHILTLTALFLCFALLGSLGTHSPIYAENDNSSTLYYSYGNDGLVDGSKDFIIPANAGENFEITITFTGIEGTDGALSIAYDRVTDDQMVANVQKDSNDRSGLLNENTKYGVEETRRFSVAAIDGDITITATGLGQITSITAIKQAEKTAGSNVTVYTIGDSLVQTYSDRYKPQTGWGQTLPLYFSDDVIFVNRAIGGRSTGNFMRQGRLNEVLCEIKPGDVVLIEFGHNDSTYSNADRFVSSRDFRYNLEDVYIKCIRDRGGIPVLVTLCNRNQYSPKGEFSQSFGEYVTAMIKAAEETNTLLIDLNAWTIEYFTNLSKELGAGITSDIIYNHAIAEVYAGEYSGGIVDNTHLQYYGAKVVSEYISSKLAEMNIPGLSEHYVPLTVTEAPSAPTGIVLSAKGVLGRIEWNAVEGADYYKVMVAEISENQTDANSNNSVYETGDYTIAGYTTAPAFIYNDAESGKYYSYKISAINAAGESDAETAADIVSSTADSAATTNDNLSEEESPKETSSQTAASTESIFDSPSSLLKIALIAMVPFASGILIGFIVIIFSSKKKKKK